MKKLIPVLIALLSSGTLAQQTSNAQNRPAPAGPQPSQELQSLTRAIGGKWSASYKLESNAGSPAGGVEQGE